MAEQRTKEIGICKVLGASVAGLWRLLSKGSIVLVGVALLIASLIAWYAMQGWQQRYSYHMEVSWWIFTLTAGGTLLITLLTVSYQSLKAAMANPVRSLKTD
ncbi:ABC-type antimicrobial peptide transport system permease subunit [Mucilaginibacter sp. SG538B]|nr:ABC-type antimicrobial peptide transport system permease subunit [Mucilaginibacter sp. SG538B]